MKFREVFLATINNENTYNLYESLFAKMIELEKVLNKNIEDIETKEEFILLLNHCIDKGTYNSINSRWSLLKKYYDFIGNKNIKLITKKDLNKIIEVNKEYEEKRYIYKEDLIKLVSKLENYSDKALLFLARNGIGMKFEAEDLVKLKVKDIDFKRNMIYNKKIDDYTMYLVKRATEEKEYVALGSYEKIIVYNMDSEYLFKTRRTKWTNDGLSHLKISGMRGRLQKIKEELNDNTIILSNLTLSYVVDKVIEHQHKIERNLTQSELRDYLRYEFGITKNVYDIRNMTKQKAKFN